jgi:hypothetical protein
LSRAKAIPVRDFEFLYVNHHADREYSEYRGDIMLFSYQRAEIKLCSVIGSHADLLALAEQLSKLLNLPVKDYSKLIV